jgi:Cu(I)/Ag(I) efflux system membrane protein CusA/SilA
MISRIIEICARNRFLVFAIVSMLTLAGAWSLMHISLDALPDISDVQVIVHTSWEGQPPDIIEDQVSYPIVTSLLAAPHVKAVRAQTMLGDSYVFVVFEDGTDPYWARSRVVEYLQQISGRLPQDVHPAIGPDATGAGWVFEYAIVDKSGTHSLADLRSLQDWHLRYDLETVPGVSEVASIGGFVRQYQVRLDPNKMLAYGIPLSTVIDRVKASTNEVGGRVLDLSGAQYLIRGLGYLRSTNDLENVAVGSKNGAPVLLRDLGSVGLGPDIREGVAEWNGEGETVGGIVVMRQGMNALKVIDGVKRKFHEIEASLPSGVEIVSGYDRSGLIKDSIATLQRDLLEEAVIVSLVILIFLFHYRSALIVIIALPIAVLVSFIPMYFLGITSNIMSLGGLALAIGVLVDAAIVMVENGYRHLSERQEGRFASRFTFGAPADPHRRRKAGWTRAFLLSVNYRGLFPSRFFARGSGRTDVSPPRVDKDSCCWIFIHSRHHSGACSDGAVDSRQAAARARESGFTIHAGALSSSASVLPQAQEADNRPQSSVSDSNGTHRLQTRKPVHATAF